LQTSLFAFQSQDANCTTLQAVLLSLAFAMLAAIPLCVHNKEASQPTYGVCIRPQEGGMFNNGARWLWNNRPPVVVLADKPKVDMDLAVHEMLK
jgi:hypothetical protein